MAKFLFFVFVAGFFSSYHRRAEEHSAFIHFRQGWRRPEYSGVLESYGKAS